MSSCRECHFLAKETRANAEVARAGPLCFTLNEVERQAAPEGMTGWSLRCRMGVWDEGMGMTKEEILSELIHAHRTDCFFFERRPSMLFPAAIELQRRQAELRELKRSHHHAVIGLWIAGIALLVTALVAVVDLACR